MPIFINPTLPPPRDGDLHDPQALEAYLRKNGLNEIIPFVRGIRFDEGYQLIELLHDEGYVCPESWTSHLCGSGLIARDVEAYTDKIFRAGGPVEIVGGQEETNNTYVYARLPHATPKDALIHMKKLLIDNYYGATRRAIDEKLRNTRTPMTLHRQREQVVDAQRRIANLSRPAELAHLIHSFSADINDVH